MPPLPPSPPIPPGYPPGFVIHEVCELKITANLDGGNIMQFSEVTLYDTNGAVVAIDPSSASSSCHPSEAEGPFQAVDGASYTKWLCAPFWYTNASMEAGTICNDDCSGASNGLCSDGGPGAEFTLCSRGTDCSDCGSRGGGRLPAPPPPPPPADGLNPDKKPIHCPTWTSRGFCHGWPFSSVVRFVCESSCLRAAGGLYG